MPRTSLMVFAVLLGALGAQATAVAPTIRIVASSAPDGRNEPGHDTSIIPELAPIAPIAPLRGRPAFNEPGPGPGPGPGAGRSGRSGTSDPGGPGRPSLARPTPPVTPAKPNPPTKTSSLPPAMAFFLARGGADACGPGCSEWIGADGAIDSGAASRLRALLNRLGGRKPPIFFHSPGGSVEGALAIGRLMRSRGLTAGVAWTIPQGCDSKRPRDAACDRIKRSGRDLPAQLDTASTMCFSACVYAVVGAAVRQIGPGAKLGIHSSSFTFADREDRASARPSPREMRETIEASYERLGQYFSDMGIDPSLVAAARAVSNDHIRVLTRAEIWRFKIDRRSFIEDAWRLSDPPTRAVHKSFVAERIGAGADFRDAMVNLTCASPDRLRIDVALEHLPGDAVGANGVRLVAGGTMRMLSHQRRTTLGGSRNEYEVSSADIPPAFFDTAGASIRISAAATSSEPGARGGDFAVTLSTAGLMPALARLMPLCGMQASATKETTSRKGP